MKSLRLCHHQVVKKAFYSKLVLYLATIPVPPLTGRYLKDCKGSMKNLMSSDVEKTLADDNVIGNLSTTDVTSFYVQMLNGKTIPINVVNSDTIGRVKEMIEDKERIPPPMQSITFKKKPLEDGKTVAEYRIQNQDTIHLTVNLRGGGNTTGPSSGAIGIEVIDGTNGARLKLEFKNSHQILKIKEMIRYKFQIPPNEKISLKFKEVELKYEDKTLPEYNIKDQDKLQFIRDGDSHKQSCIPYTGNNNKPKKTSVEGEIQAWKVEGKTQTSQVAKPSSSNKQKVASMESETKAIKLRNVSNSNGEEKAESETQASEVGKASCADSIEKANAGGERHQREVKKASSSTVSSDNNKNINYKLKNKQANVTQGSSCRR
uniref:Ubiquitin-like domain-containing protein n=1 Tax=Nelumbo nucifera TaxID=4432 RepID=A0A822ZP89_NELNU|nr:TPA_asm: hypothetical protein HUJ06_004510 [Nelumbo nucifera]